MTEPTINPCPACGEVCEVDDWDEDGTFRIGCECGYCAPWRGSVSKAIEAHNTIAPPRWIPIEEGLPFRWSLSAWRELVEVDVCRKGGDTCALVEFGYGVTEDETTIGGYPRFVDPRSEQEIDDVTAWRLHVPPRGPKGASDD